MKEYIIIRYLKSVNGRHFKFKRKVDLPDKARVFDYVDHRVGVLRAAAKSRCRVCR